MHHTSERMTFMKFTKAILALVCIMSGTVLAQEAKVTELMSKGLPNLPGKEGLMIIVDYPPGSMDPIHRHNANAFVYVLEGTIVMQVRGGKEVTLTAGQTLKVPKMFTSLGGTQARPSRQNLSCS